MKNTILLLFTTYLFASPFNSFGQKFQDRTFTAIQLKEDFKVLKAALTSIHPSLYSFQTEKQLAEKFAKVEASIEDGMTELDFLTLVSTITKSIGCGHTSTHQWNSRAERKRLKKLPIEKRDTLNYLPFNGSFRDHRLFVGESFDSILASNMEILSIDNHSITELEQKVYNFPSISEDGQGKRLTHFLGRTQVLRNIYTVYFPLKDSVELILQLPEGPIRRKFKTKKKNEFISEPVLQDSTQWDLKFREGKVKNKYRRMHSSIHFYQHINRRDVALLDITTFKSGFKPTYNLIFDYLKKQQTKHLILDLRGNLGGDIESVIKLLSHTLTKSHTFTMSGRKIPREVKKTEYKEFFILPFIRSLLINSKFKKKKLNGRRVYSRTIKLATENHFDGQVYVLINGGSFSASSFFSAILKNDKQAIFIGEESGGAAELSNAGLYFLPKSQNSSITIRIPRFLIDYQIIGAEKGRGIQPDYIVKETIDSFLKEKDVGLEKVLMIMKK